MTAVLAVVGGLTIPTIQGPGKVLLVVFFGGILVWSLLLKSRARVRLGDRAIGYRSLVRWSRFGEGSQAAVEPIRMLFGEHLNLVLTDSDGGRRRVPLSIFSPGDVGLILAHVGLLGAST